MTAMSTPGAQPFYHGTKADLKEGDLIGPGFASNFGKRKKAAYVYLTATLDAAAWAPSWRQVKGEAGSTSWTHRPVRRRSPPDGQEISRKSDEVIPDP